MTLKHPPTHSPLHTLYLPTDLHEPSLLPTTRQAIANAHTYFHAEPAAKHINTLIQRIDGHIWLIRLNRNGHYKRLWNFGNYLTPHTTHTTMHPDIKQLVNILSTTWDIYCDTQRPGDGYTRYTFSFHNKPASKNPIPLMTLRALGRKDAIQTLNTVYYTRETLQRTKHTHTNDNQQQT